MKFSPEDEVTASLLPDGEYEAVVSRAEEKFSANGNEMIELTLTIYGSDVTATAFDNLVNTPKALWKVRRFCESAELDFSTGVLTPDIAEGRNVRIATVIERQTGYRDKNKVVDYLPRGPQAARPAPVDDDVPEFLR